MSPRERKNVEFSLKGLNVANTKYSLFISHLLNSNDIKERENNSWFSLNWENTEEWKIFLITEGKRQIKIPSSCSPSMAAHVGEPGFKRGTRQRITLARNYTSIY